MFFCDALNNSITEKTHKGFIIPIIIQMVYILIYKSHDNIVYRLIILVEMCVCVGA